MEAIVAGILAMGVLIGVSIAASIWGAVVLFHHLHIVISWVK